MKGIKPSELIHAYHPIIRALGFSTDIRESVKYMGTKAGKDELVECAVKLLNW